MTLEQLQYVREWARNGNEPIQAGRWQKPQRIFVDSMSDLFHESLSNEEIWEVFGAMMAESRHTFQVLTKRPSRALAWFRWFKEMQLSQYTDDVRALIPWPLPNVHLGVSVEDQKTADERIPLLLQVPAAVRFVSAEPLLGPIDLRSLPFGPREPRSRILNALTAGHKSATPWHLDWVIVGGESGPGARPCNVEWIRSIVRQCTEAGVPAFVKQLGAKAVCQHPMEAPGYLVHTPFRDKKGGAPDEWPEDLRVRQLPDVQS